MPGALWGQPPTGVPPGDRVSSALGAGWALCGLTVAKDVHCTTARPPPVWGAGPQDLLGMGLGPRIPSRARDTPVQRPPAPPPARVLGGRCGGRRGTRGPGGGRRTLAPAVCPSVCGHSQECGNRSGAGSSGEAAGLLHLRVLTLPLAILPACPRLPHPRPRTPPSATSCLRGSGCPLTAPPYSARTPAWPCRPRTTLVCLNALQWGPGPLQTSSPDPT